MDCIDELTPFRDYHSQLSDVRQLRSALCLELRMDFAAALQPQASLKRKTSAAIFLSALRAESAPYVPLLFAALQPLELQRESMEQDEQSLASWGALTLGKCVGAIGFDLANTLHAEIKSWLLQAVRSPNFDVSGMAAYGLGELGLQDEELLSTLESVARCETEVPVENRITTRAIALRILARLDRARAAPLVASTACREFLAATQRWKTETSSAEALARLAEEIAWLQDGS